MDLNEVAVFIKVVRTGSFTKAAEELQMPNSTVSFKVSALEKRLGVTLLQRTTRSLKVTDIGQEFFRKCTQGLDEIVAAENEILSIQGHPQGLLKLTAPVELGATVLPEVIARFTKQYPKVNVEVCLSDARTDLLAEGIDLAIRAGELKDSSLIAKKLGSVQFAPFASARYLKVNGTPTDPKDLKSHELIEFLPMGRGSWKLTSVSTSAKIATSGRMMVNDLKMAKLLALAGSGIALLPTFVCAPEVDAGKLVRILPDWYSNKTPVHFVYLAQKFVQPKVSAFIQMATDDIKARL